jgi:uncharacterized phage protein (predicted DNA packaging)
MAVALEDMKAHLNVTISDDDALIDAQITAAEAHLAGWLGFGLDDEDQFPDGRPEDINQAVKMLVAHWYAERETAYVNTAAQVAEIPYGVADIVRNYRNWTF